MARYRRKPKEIEVYKYDNPAMIDCPDWIQAALVDEILYFSTEDKCLYCCTWDGFHMKINVGYYIVKLSDGNIAACSEEYLNEQYELIE